MRSVIRTARAALPCFSCRLCVLARVVRLAHVDEQWALVRVHFAEAHLSVGGERARGGHVVRMIDTRGGDERNEGQRLARRDETAKTLARLRRDAARIVVARSRCRHGERGVDGREDLGDVVVGQEAVPAGVLERLRAKLEYTNIVYSLLPAEFTLSQLQEVYERILGRRLDRRNFRKKILALGLLRPLHRQRRGAHRPAQLYAFTRREPMMIEML